MAWHDGYRAYDDDTLATLANPGLLRRAAKDVEAGRVGWAEQGDAGGVVAADGQRVTLDARGPQQARCDCPAPGICKHILGAALWLRALEPAAEADSPAAQVQAPPLAADPLAEILALEAAPLFKAAGAAAVRRAAAASADGSAWRQAGGALVVGLPALGVACRWVAGAGFAGMVSEVAAAERKAVHLIAIAALRRAHGRPLAWPDSARPAPAPQDDGRPGERERAFLRQVDAMLEELVGGGLSHVSELTSARLLALNMSARGEGLPRLAALLRNLGGTVDLLVRRDHRAEERDAFALMARIHALGSALAAADGALAGALRGRVRRAFDEAAALELLPLGAHWWHTRGGARGLTLAFWDLAGERLLQATLARPDGSDASFTRQGAWTTQSLWPGGGTARRLCEASLRLVQPRLAEDDRLALGGATRAEPLPMWRADDPRLAGIGCARWDQLGERLRAATGLAAEPFDAVLLRPAQTRPPLIDEARQRLDWLLQDTDGRWLRLGIPVDTAHRARIENLDRFAARRAPVHAVLVRIERSAARTELMPIAVLSSGAGGVLQVVSLDFADEPRAATSLANRILRLFEARQQQRQAPPPAAVSLLARLLAPVADVAETQAATGRMALTPPQRQRLQEAQERAASVGLEGLAQALRAHLAAPAPGTLLRLGYLCLLLAELDGVPERRAPQAA